MQHCEALSELLQGFFITGTLDQEPASRGTRLAGVLHDRIDEHRQRGIEVGVGEHDLRAFPAQLERDRAMTLCSLLRHRRTGRGRSGERKMIDAGVRGQRRTRFTSETGDDVERAVG